MESTKSILPPEILLQIFKYLEIQDLLNIKLVSKSSRLLAKEVIETSNVLSVKIFRAMRDSIIMCAGYDVDKIGNHKTTFDTIGSAKLKIPPVKEHPKGPLYRPVSLLIYNNQHELMYHAEGKYWYVLKDRNWVFHSQVEGGSNSCVIVMPNGIYMFCGKTSNFLPNGSHKWQQGPSVPGGHHIFSYTPGLPISQNEIVFVGAATPSTNHDYPFLPSERVLKLNIDTNDWTVVAKLQIGRDREEALMATLFNDKIIVCGGYMWHEERFIKTSEVIELKDLQNIPFGEYVKDEKFKSSIPMTRRAGEYRYNRTYHFSMGMGVIRKNGQPKLILFDSKNRFEEWNDDREIWQVCKDPDLKGLDSKRDDPVYCYRPYRPTTFSNLSESNFECDICQKVFKNIISFKAHIKILHGGKAQFYKCNICNKRFVSDQNLMNHIAASHGMIEVATLEDNPKNANDEPRAKKFKPYYEM